MVKWKKSTLLNTLTKGTRFARNYKPPKKLKPKVPKLPKAPKMHRVKKGTMRMVKLEPELHYRQGYTPKETGIYKQKRRWF